MPDGARSEMIAPVPNVAVAIEITPDREMVRPVENVVTLDARFARRQ
jgi:hypothetical protein